MKSITSLRDLEEYGIKHLTGEACNVGTRALYDLTDIGREIVCDFLGLPLDNRHFRSNYNSQAMYSMMVPYTMIEDLKVWCLIYAAGCDQVLISNDSIIGFNPGMDDEEEWNQVVADSRHFHRNTRLITCGNQPGSRTRCRSMMSGRVE